MSVAAIVLAAGFSSRLGAPKQLALIKGRPLVRHVVEAALRSSCDAIGVVVGAHAERIERALEGLEVACLSNARWVEGMSSSIRVGVAWADARPFDHVLILVADQPRTTSERIDALVRMQQRGHTMTASRYAGVLGVPAVFARSHFPALAALEGDRGARDLLRSAPDVASVDWPEGAIDVDLPRDLLRLDGG